MPDGGGRSITIPTARAFKPLLYASRYKGAYGGRASGKSHFFAGLAVEESICAKQDIVCIREVQRTLDQSVKKLIELKIQEMNAGDYFKVYDNKIKSRHDGQMIFEGMQNHTAESIKSLEGYDRALVEEAQTLSQHSLDLLRPTIRKPDSQIWFSWNPNFSSDPVDALLRGSDPPPNSTVVRVSYRDNPWLSDVSRAELQYDQRRDPDKFAHIWMGEYQRNSEARVFRNWKVEEFARPAGTIYRLGADWGFATDPSVLIRCSIEGNKLYIDYEAYMVGCEIVNLPDLFARVPESEKWFITADSARPETISHMRNHGYPKINSAIKGPKSLEDGIEFLKSFDIVVHPRCTHTIDELTLYSYKLDPLTQKVLPILEDKSNHVIDAARYALEGARRAGVKLAPQTEKQVSERLFVGAAGWMS